MHVIIWVVLLLLYPRSAHVQALLFWNRPVRRFLGFGYIDILLTWIPAARERLLAPFGATFLSEAGWLDITNYFDRVFVFEPRQERTLLLDEALPAVNGHVFLEGESGLGKSLCLRRLIERSANPRIYLRAESCSGGVVEAIASRTHGPASDAQFLEALIHVGALDIYVDGLNEASADTRAKIASFLESHHRGNIIVSSQPIEWQPPANMRILILQPLREENILGFMISRRAHYRQEGVSDEEFHRRCVEFLGKLTRISVLPDEAVAIRELLSNPMDLEFVVEMLCAGLDPNLLSLHNQKYEVMAADYQRVNMGHSFPLAAFSERVYQMRVTDCVSFTKERFVRELLCMERHRMVLRREYGDREWLFRHDRIMDFFVSQALLGKGNDRLLQHLGDARFRGAYLILSKILPLDEAMNLREAFVEYSAIYNDHTISDAFINLLRSRRRVLAADAATPAR